MVIYDIDIKVSFVCKYPPEGKTGRFHNPTGGLRVHTTTVRLWNPSKGASPYLLYTVLDAYRQNLGLYIFHIPKFPPPAPAGIRLQTKLRFASYSQFPLDPWRIPGAYLRPRRGRASEETAVQSVPGGDGLRETIFVSPAPAGAGGERLYSVIRYAKETTPRLE